MLTHLHNITCKLINVAAWSLTGCEPMCPEGKVLCISHPTNLANPKLAYSLYNTAPKGCDAIEG